jgi:drug/metabolite transporter (DMT)-like permease
MLCGSLAFAAMGTLAHAVGTQCDWQVTAFFRSGICLLLVGSHALATGTRLVFFHPPILWMRSIAGSISLLCTFYVLPRLPVADVLTLTNVFPIWIALLSWPLLKERPSAGVWLAVLCGVAGVALVQQPHFAEGNFASVLALAASLTTALAMIGLHRLSGIDHRAVVVHFSLVSLLFIVGAYLAEGHQRSPLEDVDILGWLYLLGVGGCATIGQVFLTKAYAAGAPARISVVGLSQVVFAMILDVVFHGRALDASTLLGIGLVLAPVGWLILHRKPPEVAEPPDA